MKILIAVMTIVGLSACTVQVKESAKPVDTVKEIVVAQPGHELDTEDGLLSDQEYEIVRSDFKGKGYGTYWDRNLFQNLGETSCSMAKNMTTLQELVDQIAKANLSSQIPEEELGYMTGGMMATMCYKDLERLIANN